ncbi:hypothetical protein S40285_02418 [Stachybotrys chlorohalonatus IBT 40285]|jgi:hypothetical protein|uniref:Protein kinase domain-containing protein n=1 Tax=Stachybotrys chlorohalonatus (strain IBT 40285) TaxID=1283841 RepID=A0A084R0S1_STAC4|nr:hypothetical protein S40285_02418 [Stachybotrys chlorohalonata IBT 40285]
MSGLGWSWKELEAYFRNSPHELANLNPLVELILTECPDSHIIGIGARSMVLYIAEGIAVKVALRKGDPRFLREQLLSERIDMLNCKDIAAFFFHGPDITFMELFEVTLADRLRLDGMPRPYARWMLQLTSAVAALESIDLAHADINPLNIMVDELDQLKLIDFDHTIRIGHDLDVGFEPYVRRPLVPRRDGGLYGKASHITEQFALGSVFWFMTRGRELYADEGRYGKQDLLKRGVMPCLDMFEPIDIIIHNCWVGHYESVAAVAKDVVALLMDGDASEHQTQDTMDVHERATRVFESQKSYAMIDPARSSAPFEAATFGESA